MGHKLYHKYISLNYHGSWNKCNVVEQQFEYKLIFF